MNNDKNQAMSLIPEEVCLQAQSILGFLSMQLYISLHLNFLSEKRRTKIVIFL